MPEISAPICFDTEHPHIKIVLTWTGNVDFDLSAFMLGENGYIEDDADLVFYNSLNRDSPFDINSYASEEDWIAETLPVSADGSLVGSKDAAGSDAGQVQESMGLDLSKVADKIAKVVFCVSVFQEKLQFMPPSSSLKCWLRVEAGDNTLTKFEIDFGDNAKAAEVFEMARIDSSRWTGGKVHITYTTGLQEIIDKYV